MGLPNVFNTGRSGMVAAKAAIATSGHNIANSKTEGYSRQRVLTETTHPHQGPGSHALIGTGTQVARVERINDEYIEKQIRGVTRDLSNMEEKDIVLRQTEDVFNEMNGDGLNRLVSRFFNEFRKLSNEPENEAVRQSVRESSQAMVNDFHRIRKEIEDVRRHIDARLEGSITEFNALGSELKDLNIKIKGIEIGGGIPNDLMDKRDLVLKKMSQYMDISMHKDNEGNYIVDIPKIGPYVVGPNAEKFSSFRTPADKEGKPENALDVKTTASVQGKVTHQIANGKMGALIEVRDNLLSTILDRLDDMAFTLSNSVNAVHAQGFTRHGVQGVGFFNQPMQKERAAEYIGLSSEVASSVNNIATAAQADSPGDNRIAIAISGLQYGKLMSEGKATVDDWYNSIVSDIGVASSRNRNGINQNKDIMAQLDKMRDQISGVSIDEETTNIMQFQHAFDASAKVLQVADEMLKTVLELKRT